jgi:hypothetical protein
MPALGAGWFLLSLLRCFFPSLLYSKRLMSELNEKGTARPFLLSHRINGMAFGAILILGCCLSSPVNAVVCIPLLAAVTISIVLCNAKFLGRCSVYKSNRT